MSSEGGFVSAIKVQYFEAFVVSFQQTLAHATEIRGKKFQALFRFAFFTHKKPVFMNNPVVTAINVDLRFLEMLRTSRIISHLEKMLAVIIFVKIYAPDIGVFKQPQRKNRTEKIFEITDQIVVILTLVHADMKVVALQSESAAVTETP
jgi:hypothetical protein